MDRVFNVTNKMSDRDFLNASEEEQMKAMKGGYAPPDLPNSPQALKAQQSPGYKKTAQQDVKSLDPSVSGAASAVQTASSGGNAAQSAGAGLTTAGLASANPYLVAAGLGLSVVGGAQQRKYQEKQDQVNQEIARRSRVAQLVSRLGSGVS